jgi:hypothetical protein
VTIVWKLLDEIHGQLCNLRRNNVVKLYSFQTCKRHDKKEYLGIFQKKDLKKQHLTMVVFYAHHHTKN